MAGADDLLAAVEAIHAAGVDAKLWPDALGKIAQAVGGTIATLELFEKPSLRPREVHSHGLPPAAEISYLDQYAALNRRLPIAATYRLDEIHFDYCMFDEQTIRRDPFYMEFLAQNGLRYFVGGIVRAAPHEFAGVCVHRTPQQGHVDSAGLTVMERLVPHVRGAFDVTRRLKEAGETRHSLERALDWLADGVALIGPDGAVIYANETFQGIARRKDGIAVRRGVLEFAAGEARARLGEALGATARLRKGDSAARIADFTVARSSDGPAYLVSVRPLLEGARHEGASSKAVAIIFIRDPLGRGGAATTIMREVFGFTDAEANLAQALQAGIPLGQYARARAVSLNTVYTHLRRIKEKTGCSRMPELIRKLNDVQVALRLD